MVADPQIGMVSREALDQNRALEIHLVEGTSAKSIAISPKLNHLVQRQLSKWSQAIPGVCKGLTPQDHEKT